MKYVLDTNIAVAALNGHVGVLARLANVEARDVGIPALVIGELMFGALRSRRAEANAAEVRHMRTRFPVLPVSDAVIDRYAFVRADLAARGVPKSDFDLLIACSALEHAAVLVTNDGGLKDGTIVGLVVEDWLSADP